MVIESKNIVGAGLTLLIVGLIAWGSSSLFKQPQPQERHGVVEIQSVDMTTDNFPARATNSR